jgi:hypothetical protein|tara:strand:- start:41 stop:274 length:234 start_codon:yes stop_codon:yes gene_type:complete
MTYNEQKARIMNDPAASYWLQSAIKTLDTRDPVDAIADVDALRKAAVTRWEELCKQPSRDTHADDPNRDVDWEAKFE